MTNNPVLVLGNGPSLKDFDLLTAGMATIGMNAAYRYWNQINFRPTYYVCLDLVVGMSHLSAIRELVEENRTRRFLLRDNVCKELGDNPRVMNYDELRKDDPLFAVDPITTGSHSLLFAIALGYRLIGVAGVDVNYTEILDEARRLESGELEITTTPTSNPNYFFDDYQQAGDKYNVPNPNPGLHGRSWSKVARIAAEEGAHVFNVADNSPFDLFPHLPFQDFKNIWKRSL